MKRIRSILTLVAVIALSILAALVATHINHKEDLVHSPKKNGFKALYLILNELGFKTERHTGSLKSLPKDARVVLLIRPPNLIEQDQKALRAWIEKGNTAIVAGSYGFTSFNYLDITREPYARKEYTAVPIKPGGPYTEGVREIYVSVPTFGAFAGQEISRIAEDHNDKTLVGEIKLGKGRVIAFIESNLFQNCDIDKKDNVVLITNVVCANAHGGRVVFCEDLPKASPRETSNRLPFTTTGWIVLSQILFAVLLVLISAGKRFGAIHPLIETTKRRRSWELVRAMAELLRRAEAKEAAFISIYRDFRRELTYAFGVAPDADPETAVNVISAAYNTRKAQLSALLVRGEEIVQGGKSSESEVLKLIDSIEKLRRELEIARPTNKSE